MPAILENGDFWAVYYWQVLVCFIICLSLPFSSMTMSWKKWMHLEASWTCLKHLTSTEARNWMTRKRMTQVVWRGSLRLTANIFMISFQCNMFTMSVSMSFNFYVFLWACILMQIDNYREISHILTYLVHGVIYLVYRRKYIEYFWFSIRDHFDPMFFKNQVNLVFIQFKISELFIIFI